MKTKSAAVLTIKSPGSMSRKGRRDIADWLKRQADMLLTDGDKYTDGGFIARYLYPAK